MVSLSLFSTTYASGFEISSRRGKDDSSFSAFSRTDLRCFKYTAVNSSPAKRCSGDVSKRRDLKLRFKDMFPKKKKR